MRGSNTGFTLIELLVAIAIVAILTTVAVASYQEHVASTRRAAAKGVLVEVANWLERQYSTNGCYFDSGTAACPGSNAAITLPTNLTRSPREGNAKSYLVSAVSNDANGQSYTLTATPCGTSGTNCAGGTFTDDEFTDSKCGKLTLTHTGAQGVLDASASVSECWQR